MASPVAVVLLVFGLPMVIWPYKISRFEERMDSIGSKRSWSEVEPADWKVFANRVLGILFVLIGIAGVLGG